MHVYRVPKILILEGQLLVAADVSVQLSKLGYDVMGISTSLADLLEIMESNRPDIILMNSSMQARFNDQVPAKVVLDTLEIPVVFLSANQDMQAPSRVGEVQPYAWVSILLDQRHLQNGIENALNRMREEGLWTTPKELSPRKRCSQFHEGLWDLCVDNVSSVSFPNRSEDNPRRSDNGLF
jgi:DNA-binding NarL/FixJ family response regulator